MELIYIDLQMDLLTAYKIKNLVAEYFDVTVWAMDNSGREQPLCTYRMIAMYFCKVYSENTLTEIADIFGGRTHKSADNAIEQIDNLINTNKNFRTMMFEIKGTIELQLLNND